MDEATRARVVMYVSSLKVDADQPIALYGMGTDEPNCWAYSENLILFTSVQASITASRTALTTDFPISIRSECHGFMTNLFPRPHEPIRR